MLIADTIRLFAKLIGRFLFEDGNGRVARLLTGALLSEHGYTVGRYVSLEQTIAESADA